MSITQNSKYRIEAKNLPEPIKDRASELCGGYTAYSGKHTCWNHCRPVVGGGYAYCVEGAREAIEEAEIV